MPRLFRPVLISVLTVMCAVGSITWSNTFFAKEYPPNWDVDLHYYGAIAERDDSFTDTARVRTLLDERRHRSHSEGVVGSPALIALFYIPLSHLPIDTAEVTWRVIALTAIGASLLYAAPRRLWPYLPLALCLEPFLLGMYLGNFSMITFAFLAVAYGSLRRGKSTMAAASIGLAAAFKIFPAFLFLSLIVQRKWRATAIGVAACALANLAAVAVLGPNDFVTGMQHTLSFSPFSSAYLDNVSAPGVLYWVTRNSDLFQISNIVVLLIGAVLVVRRRHAPAHVLFAATTLVLMLGHSLTWSHYMTVLVIGVLAVIETGIKPIRLAMLLTLVGTVLRPTFRTQHEVLIAAVILVVLYVAMRKEQISKAETEPAADTYEPSPT